MEHRANCPICNSLNSKALDHPLYKQCLACSGIYQFKEITPIDDYYKHIDRVPNFSHQVGSYKNYINIIKRVIKPEARFTLVDIGAGDGTFLQLCREKLDLKNYYAVEESKTALNVLKEKHIEATKRLNEIANKIVVCLQVIEHIDKPISFLESLFLQQGDYIVMTSPSVDSKYFARYGRYWRSFSPSHHLVLYSKQSLELLFKQFGIDILSMITVFRAHMDPYMLFWLSLRDYCCGPCGY